MPAVLVAAVLVVVGQLYVVIPLLPSMSLELSISAAASGTLTSSFGLAYAVGFLVLGPLTDRYGSRRVVVAGLVATSLATVLVASAATFYVVLVGRAVQGFVAAALTPAVLTYVARQVPAAQRPLVMAAVVGSALAAALVAQIAAQLIEPALGWRGLFWGGAAVMAVITVAVARVLLPEDRDDTRSLGKAYRELPHVLRDRRSVLLLLAAATLLAAYVAIYTRLEVGPSPVSGGDSTVLLLLRLAALPAVVAMPLLIPRLGRLSVRGRLLGALAVASLAAALCAPAFGLVVLGGSLFVLTAAIALAAPALIGELLGRSEGRVGAASALYSAAVFAGASLGGTIVTVVSSASFAATALCGAAVLLAGGVAAALSLLDERRRP